MTKNVLCAIDINRPEEEHRKIFTPYSTTSAFAGGNNKPTSTKDENGEEILYISKTFSFGQFGPLYHWMGRVSAMAEQLGCFPDFDWFFLEVTATVPMTKEGLTLAWYMTDEEAMRANNRNTSEEIGVGDH